MIRPTTLALTALAALCAAPAARPAPADTSTRRSIEAVQKRFMAAVRAKKEREAVALMTPGYTNKTLNGRVLNRSAAEREMRRSWPTVSSFGRWQLNIRSLEVQGDTAVGLVDEQLLLNVKQGDGIQAVAVVGRNRNTWKRTPQGWRYHRMEELEKRAAPVGINYVSFKTLDKETTRERKLAAARAAKAAKAAKKPALSTAQARRILDDAYARYRSLTRAKNVSGLMAMFTPDYVVDYPDRSLPRRRVEAAIRQDIAATKSIASWTMNVRRVDVVGNSIVALVDEQKTSTVVDASGKARRTVAVNQFRDTWTPSGGGWKNRRTEIVKARVSS